MHSASTTGWPGSRRASAAPRATARTRTTSTATARPTTRGAACIPLARIPDTAKILACIACSKRCRNLAEYDHGRVKQEPSLTGRDAVTAQRLRHSTNGTVGAAPNERLRGGLFGVVTG